MTGDIGLILRELANVQDQLTSLPDDSDAEKLVLLARQDVLCTRAARLADQVDEGYSTQDLLTKLAGLRWQRDALQRQHVGDVGRSGPHRNAGHGGPGNGIATGSPEKVRHPRSHPRIESRIGRISHILADRGIKLR